MRRGRYRRLAVGLTALSAAGACAVASAAQAAPAASPAAVRTGAAQAAAAGSPPLLLVTGDRLVIRATAGGRTAVGLLPAPGSAGLVSVAAAGAEVPVLALPYLGRGLDPSLFELSALRKAEAHGRLPVRVTFSGRRPALPGVTITSSRPGAESGYLTAASARVFGAALVRQFRSDHARGGYGSDGLFAGGTVIALPGAPARSVARPAFPMHTLTVRGSDLTGGPDTGDVVSVFNADSFAAFPSSPFGSDNVFYHGTAKYSVPSGRYWAIAQFFDFPAHGAPSIRLDVLPQFTVGGDTTVRVSERAASSQVTVATPRPAVTQSLQLTIIRATRGQTFSFGYTLSGIGLWVSPTSQPPADGTLQTFTGATLTSPPGPGIPYAYNLDFPGPPGIIPAQHFTVTPGGLATVAERYFQDLRSAGAWLTFGGTAYQIANSFIGGLFIPLRLPARQVQYLSAPMLWQSLYLEYQTLGLGQTEGGQTGTLQSVSPGEQLTQDWNRFPLHPAPTVSLPGSPFFALPSAVRAGNTLILDIAPFGDNQFGHTGSGFSCGFSACGSTVTGSYALYQNGTKIAGGDAAKAAGGAPAPFVQATLSPKPARITFVLSASRESGQYQLSGASRDVWTWQSHADPGATVPPPWYCGFSKGGPDQHCVIQPMLTLRYQVRREALNGTAPAGQQVIWLSAAPLQAAIAPPVTGATAQVSFNDGRTWRSVTVTPLGGGGFRLGYSAPSGVDVTLRVSARDAAGDSVTETILRAYGVA